MNMKKALPLIAIAALLPASCSKPVPVAQVEVNPPLAQLPFSQIQTVRLTWTPSGSIGDEKPTVFVHVLDAKQKVARTFDHPFPQRWREGAPVSYDLKLYQSAMAQPLAPGKYQVTLGLYGKNGKRWPLSGLGDAVGRDEYNAFQVQVPNADSRPRFAFSPNWMDVEPGGDRQVLARRWLVDRGAIRLVDQHAPGTVWMVVQIPPASLPDYRVVLDEGASAPSVMIRGNCLPGHQHHRVRAPRGRAESGRAGARRLLPPVAERQLLAGAAQPDRQAALGLAGEHRLGAGWEEGAGAGGRDRGRHHDHPDGATMI